MVVGTERPWYALFVVSNNCQNLFIVKQLEHQIVRIHGGSRSFDLVKKEADKKTQERKDKVVKNRAEREAKLSKALEKYNCTLAEVPGHVIFSAPLFSGKVKSAYGIDDIAKNIAMHKFGEQQGVNFFLRDEHRGLYSIYMFDLTMEYYIYKSKLDNKTDYLAPVPPFFKELAEKYDKAPQLSEQLQKILDKVAEQQNQNNRRDELRLAAQEQLHQFFYNHEIFEAYIYQKPNKMTLQEAIDKLRIKLEAAEELNRKAQEEAEQRRKEREAAVLAKKTTKKARKLKKDDTAGKASRAQDSSSDSDD